MILLPAVRLAGFTKRLRFRIDITRKVKAWIVGANRQIWNKGNAWPIAETIATESDKSGGDSPKSLGEQAVRIRHLLQTPRDAQRQSRQVGKIIC